MRIRVSGVIGAAGMLIWTGCTASEREPARTPDVTEEVGRFLESYVSAIDSRDTGSVSKAYVDDGRFVWIEDGKVRYRSAEEILASLEGLPGDTPIRTDLTNLTIVPVGATAAHAWATFTTTMGTGPDSFSFGGAISFVTERIDGSWKLVGGHTSSPSGR